MLTIWTNKIKHSTVGSSFSVTFSVAPNELEYLNKLYDCFSSMNWSSFPITADRNDENNSEIPNNCEHITEDGVTCAKYPACDDCLDNPLNKVKGSERLVKSSEQTEPTISKMEQVEDEPQTCSFSDCDNFKNPDYKRCIECKRKQIKLKTEQAERESE